MWQLVEHVPCLAAASRCRGLSHLPLACGQEQMHLLSAQCLPPVAGRTVCIRLNE